MKSSLVWARSTLLAYRISYKFWNPILYLVVLEIRKLLAHPGDRAAGGI